MFGIPTLSNKTLGRQIPNELVQCIIVTNFGCIRHDCKCYSIDWNLVSDQAGDGIITVCSPGLLLIISTGNLSLALHVWGQTDITVLLSLRIQFGQSTVPTTEYN